MCATHLKDGDDGLPLTLLQWCVIVYNYCVNQGGNAHIVIYFPVHFSYWRRYHVSWLYSVWAGSFSSVSLHLLDICAIAAVVGAVVCTKNDSVFF